mmetsp:Transcript_11912/g.30040  ORF Transcript_11912/g.30040 Transcript_11912/m.30040 type:complete len:118 (+) Transcript_11912:360-713(+)
MERIEDGPAGVKPPRNIVGRMLRTLRRQSHPLGRGLRNAQHPADIGGGVDGYVRDITYMVHKGRPGFALIFGNEKLIGHAAQEGRFGYDGTHGVLAVGLLEHPNGDKVELLSSDFKC